MAIRTDDITLAGLLHDIGKICHRTGEPGTHSVSGKKILEKESIKIPNKKIILEAVENHHVGALKNSKLASDHPAYIIYEADNIAAAVDRREEEGQAGGFDKRMPLHSVFNVLKNDNAQMGYAVVGMDVKKQTLFPMDLVQAKKFTNQGDYNGIKSKLEDQLTAIDYEADGVNSVLKLMEAIGSYVPSSTNLGETPDISLFDHLKLTAAIGAAMYLFQETKGEKDYRKHYFSQCELSRKEEQFLFVSGDISGIQDFIYTISSKGALKSLRGRSFYIEMLVENMIDDLLEQLELSRANLLYSGGGHFYILCPNTEKTQTVLKQSKNAINRQLLEITGLGLYCELQGIPCSAHDLANDMGSKIKNKNLTSQLYDKVNKQIAQSKLNRYELDELEALFDPNSSLNNQLKDGRECSICKTSTTDIHPWKRDSDAMICEFCESLFQCGDQLARISEKDMLVTIYKNQRKNTLKLPSANGNSAWLKIESWEEVLKNKNEKPYHRIYSVNQLMTGKAMATNLWVGNYNIKNTEESGLADFDQLAKASNGVKRLGVLRADVDSLGAVFINGFSDSKYNTLSRFTTLSRQLSMFFKNVINDLCQGKNRGAEHFTLPGKTLNKEKRNIVIVYSGGDDVFVVGAWDEVLEFSIDLFQAFKEFTSGKLSFSAGLGLYHSSYPISRMAMETGELEAFAKEQPGKNAISLFGGETKEDLEANSYSWESLVNRIIGEKLNLFNEWFQWENQPEDKNKIVVGMSFIYQLLDLFKGIDNHNINIARIAYVLARREPNEKEKSTKTYKEMKEKIYEWAIDEVHRKEFLTALTLYVYLNRKE